MKALLEEYTCRSLLKSEIAKPPIANRSAEDARYRESTLKLLREREAEVNDATDKQISRQFRLVSMKCHPDRHGSAFEEEFEGLRFTYILLKNPVIRAKYIDGMVDFMERASSTMTQAQIDWNIQEFHNSFMRMALEEKETQNVSTTAVRPQDHYYLETTMFQQPPKAPHLIQGHNMHSGKNIAIGLKSPRPGK